MTAKSFKNITDNFWTDIINNKKAASIFTLTHIFFNLFILRYDLDHTFCWLILKFLVSKKLYLISLILKPFQFCSFLSFFHNLACFKEKSTWFSSEVSFGDFEQIWKHFPDYQMKTNFWRNQLQWTLTTTVYNEL